MLFSVLYYFVQQKPFLFQTKILLPGIKSCPKSNLEFFFVSERKRRSVESKYDNLNIFGVLVCTKVECIEIYYIKYGKDGCVQRSTGTPERTCLCLINKYKVFV